ncbi:MAG: tyrosine-type recombinase/integrase [Verrucomicrobiales bacterium]
MASLRTLPKSPYWIACFTLPNGTRTQRSTGIPVKGFDENTGKKLQKIFKSFPSLSITLNADDKAPSCDAREAKRIAQQIAVAYESAARSAKTGRLVEDQARKVISDIYVLANGHALQSSTIKDYCATWLSRKQLAANSRTHERYSAAIKHVLNYLGDKANRDLSHLSVKEIEAMMDHISKTLSPNSANYTVKVLRAMLNDAKRKGFIQSNEATRVELIQKMEKNEKRAFTLPELEDILNAANNEWRGMILVGIYTGLRLGDIALLTWANLDLQNAEIKLTTQKTDKRQNLPIAAPLLKHLETLPAGDDPSAPLFPEACASKQRNPHGGPLSNQFYGILAAVGLVKPRTHKSKGKGRDSKREFNPISFHSLRHTATSLLKNAGVSDVIARDIIGHDSEAVSRNYTHIDHETKRLALNKLPDITVRLSSKHPLHSSR